MKPTVLLAILSICLCSAIPARAADPFFEHSYAVVIGIDNYSPPFPKLRYGVKDAQAIATYLRKQGYEIIPLYNQDATKQGILAAMQNMLAPKLKNSDRVLFFFAGHGHTETLGGQDRGYIVPFDGGPLSASYISMDELANQSSYMDNARHQLFIMDSCYGGILAGTRASMVNTGIPDYLREVSRRYARQVITAGGKDQQVLDGGPKGHSYFVDYLLEALDDGLADTNGDGYITFDELSAYLTPRASIHQQTPASGILPRHGAGEYLFRSPRAGTLVSVSSPAPAGSALRGAAEPAAAALSPVPAAPRQAAADLPHGIELATSGKCQEALPYLQRGLAIDPQNAGAHSLLGRCLATAGDYRAAYNAFTQAIRLDQRRAEYFLERARAAYSLGQYDLAAGDVDQILAINKREPAAYDLRGDLAMKIARYGEAANAYKLSLDLQADSRVCNKYADAIGRNGNRDLADEVRRNCGR
ncbi:MAG: hypothetical protein C5B51_18010 [Terriglobia bacterium]|nr:MAG: hypothetical protein C5B51_18010 [Terriglobia bacterium]